MNSKITVVMPCLNVVKYIDKCMHSVINQTLSDIEIIVVDAGSTDGTLEILESYCQNDDRILVIHSDRKSYGYQMNIGIARAVGDYIAIVETDDIIEPDMFETLYEVARTQEVDYVKGTAQYYYEFDKHVYTIPYLPLDSKSDSWGHLVVPKNTPNLFYSDNFLWNGIYRNDFLKSIVFHETPGAAFQDISALYQIISKANSAIYVNKLVYNYRKDNESASSYNKNGFRYLNSEYNRIRECYLNVESPEWIQIYYEKMFGLCESIFQLMAATGFYWESEEQEIIQIQDNLKRAIDSGMLSKDQISDLSRREKQDLFVEEPRLLFEKLCHEYNERRAEVEKILLTTSKKTVVIVGAGLLGKFIYSLLVKCGSASNVYFSDNNAKLRNAQLYGKSVMSVYEAYEQCEDGYYVVCNKNHSGEIEQQLREMGVKEDNILTYSLPRDLMLFLI